MASGNEVTVVGNATRAPELRFTPSGQAVASFGLAVNRRWQDKTSQEWQEATSFFDVTAWSNLAENAAQSIEKGSRVVVVGRLDQQQWETPEGDKRSKIQIVADEIAPSLKWATCQVTKVVRQDGAGGGVHQGRPQGRDVPNQAPDGYVDEDPF